VERGRPRGIDRGKNFQVGERSKENEVEGHFWRTLTQAGRKGGGRKGDIN